MTRPDWQDWALGVAEAVARRGDCTRGRHYHLGCPDPECAGDTFCACGTPWPCAEGVAAEVADTDADILQALDDLIKENP